MGGTSTLNHDDPTVDLTRAWAWLRFQVRARRALWDVAAPNAPLLARAQYTKSHLYVALVLLLVVGTAQYDVMGLGYGVLALYMLVNPHGLEVPSCPTWRALRGYNMAILLGQLAFQVQLWTDVKPYDWHRVRRYLRASSSVAPPLSFADVAPRFRSSA